MQYPALDISGLRKSYNGTLAVDGISFQITPGEFFGFLGPNGAGKTTTINCITGVNVFREGTISVFGHDVVRQYRQARRRIGLAPQEFNIDPFVELGAVLGYVGGYYGMGSAERKRRIAEVLDLFDLGPHVKKQFRELSGGLKRRVMMARALIHNPDLVILDEPTAGVDVELRHDIWSYLRELNAQGKTILLTSHYLEEVEMLCNRVAIICEGNIVTDAQIVDLTKEGRKLEETYLEITAQYRTI